MNVRRRRNDEHKVSDDSSERSSDGSREDASGHPASGYPRVREKTDLPHHPPYQLINVSQLLNLGTSRMLQSRFGISVREWRVLAILGHYGPLSAADLVGRAAFDKGTVSRTVSRLQKRGYVRRGPHPSDARSQLLYLTEPGVELHDRIAPISRMRWRIIAAALTPQEREALGSLLDKVRSQLEWLNREEENDFAEAGSQQDPATWPPEEPGDDDG